jgi:tRNA-Thr(GGU) m(6)t(6)A37 methyltransferase TsaA
MIIEPVGFVCSGRTSLADDFWGGVESVIELVPEYGPTALDGLLEFSHAEIVYHFHRVEPESVVATARHPRQNQSWPKVGIFAQRARARPNRIGTTIVRIVACAGTQLRVVGLDAIEGTPVLDIKPVMREFLPREPVTQPGWSTELMRDYWRIAGDVAEPVRQS